jgi:hypothetical protein
MVVTHASLSESPISTDKNLGVVAHTCHPNYMEKINRRISVSDWSGNKCETLFKNSLKQKGWRYGLGGRVSA